MERVLGLSAADTQLAGVVAVEVHEASPRKYLVAVVEKTYY